MPSMLAYIILCAMGPTLRCGHAYLVLKTNREAWDASLGKEPKKASFFRVKGCLLGNRTKRTVIKMGRTDGMVAATALR